MSFADAVAQADTFWGTLAVVDAALIVAVVVEGRSVREEIERAASQSGPLPEAEALRGEVEALRGEMEALSGQLEASHGEAEAPRALAAPSGRASTRSVLKSMRSFEKRARAFVELLKERYPSEPVERLVLAFTALAALGFSIVLALMFLVPVAPPGAVLTVVGFVLAVGSALLGLAVLALMGARRMGGGQRLSKLLRSVFSKSSVFSD